MKSSIRQIVQKYHRNLYQSATLYEKGTWLEKPEQSILDLVDTYFVGKPGVKVLDLGSGVGRNAIPIAQRIAGSGGQVICVDFLDIATQKLHEYAKKYSVDQAILGYTQEVEKFKIKPKAYDFILSHGVLNHVGTKSVVTRVIQNMTLGTKSGGFNYLALITDLVKSDADTGVKLPVDVEAPFSFDDACRLLKKLYSSWKIFTINKDPYEEKYIEEGRNVIWKANFLVFVAQKV